LVTSDLAGDEVQKTTIKMLKKNVLLFLPTRPASKQAIAIPEHIALDLFSAINGDRFD
jgi:hypothetical protein